MKFLVEMDVKNAMLQCLAMSSIYNKFAEEAVEKFDDDLTSGEAFVLGQNINYLKNCAGQIKNQVTVMLDVSSEYNLIIPKSIFDSFYYEEYVSFYQGICGELNYLDNKSVTNVGQWVNHIQKSIVFPVVKKYDIYKRYTVVPCNKLYSNYGVHQQGIING